MCKDMQRIYSRLAGFGCPIGTFSCKNNKCIPDGMKCDGKDDCGDRTDEEDGCKSNLIYIWQFEYYCYT